MRVFKEVAPGCLVTYGDWLGKLFVGLAFFLVAIGFGIIFVYAVLSFDNEIRTPYVWIGFMFIPVVGAFVGGMYLFLWRKMIIDRPAQTVTLRWYLFGFQVKTRMENLRKYRDVTLMTTYETTQRGHSFPQYSVMLGKLECYKTLNARSATENAEFLAGYLGLPLEKM